MGKCTRSSVVRQLGNVAAMEGGPRAEHGGFPLWHRGLLWWADISRCRLHCLEPRSGTVRSWRVDSEIGAIVPCTDGSLLIATKLHVWRFRPGLRTWETLAQAPYNAEAWRFNEGIAGPDGHLWIGTYSKGPLGMLYRFVGGEFQPILVGAGACNGLAWSPNGRTMYWSDTRARVIHAYTVEDGMPLLHTRRVFFNQFDPPARPDCAAIDEHGNYWVAVFEGGCVLCISPEGVVLLKIDLRNLGVLYPTKVFFCGENLSTLGITTSCLHLSQRERTHQPLAGRVLQVEVNVAGLPARAVRL